jgi:hypothetical protein
MLAGRDQSLRVHVTREALARLPLTRKRDLIELQQKHRPLAA